MALITATDYAKNKKIDRQMLMRIIKHPGTVRWIGLYHRNEHGERITDKNTFLTINVV